MKEIPVLSENSFRETLAALVVRVQKAICSGDLVSFLVFTLKFI
jgi:hypothetical protein